MNTKIAINVYYEPSLFLQKILHGAKDFYITIKSNSNVKYKCDYDESTLQSIHSKNSTMNELTIWYWLWKNKDLIQLPNYIGYNHYRRLFNLKDVIDIDKYDIVVGNSRRYKNPQTKNFEPRSQYYRNHVKNDLLLFESILKQINQQAYSFFENFLDNGPRGELYAPCNMFVMKKDIFFKYCELAFPPLLELERKIDLTNRDSYQRRAIAFISERLFSSFIYSLRELVKIKHVPIMLLENGVLADENE